MDDPDLNFLQTYKLEAITEPRYLHDVEAARALLEKTCVPAR